MNFLKRLVILISAALLLGSTLTCFAVSNQIELTEEEKQFIKDHPVIKIGVDPAFIPYEFIDNDGDYKGIAADYIHLISERCGLVMDVEKGLTWPDAYDKAVRKELDVLPCVSKSTEREKNFLYSEPYYVFKRAIFIKESNRNIDEFNDLYGLRVAVQKNSSHHSYLQSIDGIDLVLYDSVEEALTALDQVAVDAFVGNDATTNYIMHNKGIDGIKRVEMEAETEQSLYFAVRNDWPVLVGIINKGLNSITAEDKYSISQKWFGQTIDPVQRNLIVAFALVGCIVLIALIVSIFWIAALKKEIKLRQKIQEELKILKEGAEAANHFKSVFLSRMSHEIRTPLNAITGMAYLVSKTEVTSTQRIYLNKITQSAKNMLGIINDILDFSKVEAGKIDIERISFNLDHVLAQVVNLVSYQIEEKGIDFVIERSPELPAYFMGDPTRIQQVVLNVVSNAIKFTNEGAVSVTVSKVNKTEDIYGIEFKIKDTGIGMSREQVGQIFIPFNQADPSIGRRFGGTGLGLTITKNLIEQMGGTVDVQSAEGLGSVFTIQLALEEDLSQSRMERPGSAEELQKLRVLVIEKSAFYLNLIREYLHSFHIAPEIAVSDEIGIGLLMNAEKTGNAFDLLILDYATPKNDGIAYYEEIKRKVSYLPKCIMLIPISKEYLFENIRRADINIGISKPFLPSALYNAIIETNKERMIIEADENAASLDGASIEDAENYHVLIVEDNKTNQYIAQALLTRVGLQVTLAGDGREGYDLFSVHKDEIDLVLMDLHMPVMDGFDSTKLIKSIRPDVPVIALTADAITGIEEKCKSCGIDQYISKPFDPDKFIGIVRTVLKNTKKASPTMLEKPFIAKNIPVNVPSIDQKDGLMHVAGDEELYYEILGEFYKENLNVAEHLQEAIDSGHLDEALQIVHKIKGSSGNVGAKGLYAAATALHTALRASQFSKIASSNYDFMTAYDQAYADLRIILKLASD